MEKDIKDLTRDELTNPGFVKSVYENYEDEEERNKILCGVVEVAKELRVLGKVKKEIDKCNKDLRVNKRLVNGDVSALLEFDQYGNPLSNTSNYVLIMNNDSNINKRFVYDIFSNKILRVDQGEPTMWSDMDDSELRVYIEETYGVYNQQKYYDAFNKVLFERKFHPIKYLIEKEEWDGTPRIDRFLTDILKCPDDDYHREVSRMIFYGGISRLYNPGCKFDYMPILIGKQGCVDCDTEYFNGIEWKKISDYNKGDKVLQYNSDGTANLVYPLRYIKQKSDVLWEFKTKYSVNQCLSDEHNVYYLTSKDNLYCKAFREIRENQDKSPFKGKIITTFDYSGDGINLSDDVIRVMIAVFADGSYYSKVKEHNPSYNTCRFHIKKDRKKERLRILCKNANIPLRERESKEEGYTDFYISTPFRAKSFPSDWYNCNKNQFKIIAEEIMYWDGDFKRKAYSTTNKKDADFVQFVFNSLGKHSSINTRNYVGEKYKEKYIRKSVLYTVRYSDEKYKTLNMSKNNYTKFNKYIPKDGFEYCFTVPSGILVLRRNNCVFVTGNCGKSSIINWLALHDNYFTDISSIEGKDALEQLQGRWVCEFAELLAMVRTKDVEAMKGFITRTTDKFRQSYGRRTNEYPRQCIFIGTTNDYNFLVDKTGNRRYLPVQIGLKQGELFKNVQYVKDYIMSCWREALCLFNNNLTYLTIPSKYQKQMEKAQENVMEDDPKTGLIEAYLMDKKPGELVCGLEIFTKCLHNIRRNYNRSEANEISRFMSYRKDWVRCKKSVRFPEYGVQGCWEKIEVLGDDLD